MMQFFLHEIVARAAAAWVFVNTSQSLQVALAERKLTFAQHGLLETLFNLPDSVTRRDTNPFRYWFLFSGEVFLLVGCVLVVIFGGAPSDS